MNSKTNIICLLLAVAGLSFGIGQSVGQDRAEAGASSARVQSVKDGIARNYLRYIYREQNQISNRVQAVTDQTHKVCLNVRELVDSTFPPSC